MHGISWLAEDPLRSQEGLWSMELVTILPTALTSHISPFSILLISHVNINHFDLYEVVYWLLPYRRLTSFAFGVFPVRFHINPASFLFSPYTSRMPYPLPNTVWRIAQITKTPVHFPPPICYFFPLRPNYVTSTPYCRTSSEFCPECDKVWRQYKT